MKIRDDPKRNLMAADQRMAHGEENHSVGRRKDLTYAFCSQRIQYFCQQISLFHLIARVPEAMEYP